MVGMVNKQPSHWWWFENHNTSKRSPWLRSTLAELDHKTGAMLKLIEADADSFAQRAEMYYKKRPELISMVEEFYRSHRSLAEKYDQLKSDSGTRVLTTLRSPFSSTEHRVEKWTSGLTDQTYDRCSKICVVEDSAESETCEEFYRTHRTLAEKYDQVKSDSFSSTKHRVEKLTSGLTDQTCHRYSEICEVEDSAESETCETEDSAESEVDDPELEDDERECQTSQIHEKPTEERVFSATGDEELRKLKEEVERLQEENRAQKDLLKQKDEDKREVIRHLSLAVDVLKEENVKLRKCLAKDSPKWQCPFEFNKLKESFLGKMFKNGSQNHPVVAL
ncbi:Protein Networked (NET), actin-binding (NAB) domain containing protein [Parasponia andersonii]|uniref:Protein Networked (NET), actin-binding (NAB) domain containing protein n=1 Tax=Parasponia andersonii TaxID=3476 RepID=A0A2P5C830_PARAD|nr:Protein Networked (NET), actin-binding (NAB) domain containing protein [Parasponia andersonii]